MDKQKICIDTKILKQDYRAVVYFNVLVKNRMFLVISVSSIIVSVAVLLQKFLGYNVPDFMFYISVLILVCILILILSTEILIRKYISSDKVSIGTDIQIIVDSEKLVYNKKSTKSTAEYRFDMLYRAYNTKNYFLIFIDYQQAIIIRKSDMNTEDIQKLNDILKQNNILK